ATGIVGQQAMSILHKHPQFEITALAASEKSSGKRYSDAITRNNVRQWYAEGELPAPLGEMKIQDAAKLNPVDLDVVFSCVESDVAKTLEPKFAQHCAVISTASAFRYEEDVPLIIPQVNPEHSKLIETQRKNRKWKGFIAPIPNCTTTGLAISLKPLDDAFGLKEVVMTSMQAISGAGRSPGVVALDIIDNVIPFIQGEEEKVQSETQKILGKNINVSSTCTRIPVLEGHTETVFAKFEKNPTPQEAAKVMQNFKCKTKTYSTPEQLIKVFTDPSRPQPRLDRDTGNGLTTCVGRLRSDPVLGLKYIVLSHNTKMGAAAGAVWLAELLQQQGYIISKR
ncbi:MAG: aspartate-semialdehyde dehydrogenase, partial [Candidatus Micrarchaeota archaeon]|nr:aspartate-semialdehyde dehydrogenase [Candidatus Micrarchaeota archaeon]